jgi:tripartite-type tricarboxylate transporter receptor subunit TctC
VGRPFAAPPGTPADRVAALRMAFAETVEDPEFGAAAEQTGLEVDPLLGEEIENTLAKAYAAPKAIVARAAALVEPSAAKAQ